MSGRRPSGYGGDQWLERRLAEGRGQGEGSDYTPFWTVRDVPSRGLALRVRGHTVRRVHHLLSRLEAAYFYVVDRSPIVADIREQYPLLPRTMVVELAERLGVKPPRFRGTRHPYVMTTDLVLTVRDPAHEGGRALRARAIKPSGELAKPRVQELLRLERAYWAELGVDWGVVTERELPTWLWRNAEFLHGYWRIRDRVRLDEDGIAAVAAALTALLREGARPLRAAAAEVAAALGLRRGPVLAVAYHLIATQQWRVNLTRSLFVDTPLRVEAAELFHPGEADRGGRGETAQGEADAVA